MLVYPNKRLQIWYQGTTQKGAFSDLIAVTLTKGQVKFFPKRVKKNTHTTGYILDAISPTDFILSTKVQPSQAY